MKYEIDWVPIATIVASATFLSWILITDFQERNNLRKRVDELEIEVARQKNRAATFEKLFHHVQLQSLK